MGQTNIIKREGMFEIVDIFYIETFELNDTTNRIG